MVAKHTLTGYLRSRLSAVLTPIIHAAVLPYSRLDAHWDVPDAPRELLFDGDQLERLGDGLATLLKKHHDPDIDDPFVPVGPTIQTLRRTHEAMQNIPQWAKLIESTGDALAEEQERLYRQCRGYVEMNRRLREARGELAEKREELQRAGTALERDIAEMRQKAF